MANGDEQANAGDGAPASQAQPAAGPGAAAAGSPPPPPLPTPSGGRAKLVRLLMAGALAVALLEALRRRLRSRWP